MSSASASTQSERFIAPYVATMDASGGADYVYVQQETVTIAGIDYEFDVILAEASAKQLLEAFTVTGYGVDANLNVTLSSAADFKAVLMSVINGAEVASKGGKTATTQLELDLHNGLLAAIQGDQLINAVQNVDFTNVDVTIDASSGADDMANNLSDERCKLIYTQIPWGSRVGKYQDASENQTTSALPLLGGDVLTFVFDVDLSEVTPNKSQEDITAVTDVSSAAVSGNYTSTLHFNLDSKRIAFNLAMPGAAGEELTGLKA